MKNRIGFIDFLRGFALLGILVVNLPYFSKPMFIVASLGENSTLLDSVGSWIVAFFFESKFYVLFSFLFGYGFFIQLENNTEANSKSRYFRRILGLGILGLLHGVFLFIGDILLSYSILGALLWFLRNKSSSWLLKLSLLCLVIAVFCRIGMSLAEVELKSQLTANLPRLLEETRKAYLGGFWESNVQRTKDTILSIPFLVFYQWPTVFSMFCLGFYAAKNSLFTDWERIKPGFKKYFPWALLFGILGNLVYTLYSRHILPENPSIFLKIIYAISDTFSAPALTFCYVYLLGNYYNSGRSFADRIWFEAMGKFSLTCYLGESLVCTWIFCGWGLGYFDQLGSYIVLLLTVPIWIFFGAFSLAWKRYFNLGPMEWILRSWTYWKIIKIF
ncbi:hypothetical protein CH352_04950 [Leptospira hartskeerlii]|uniref:DUF418 domain-containing protein n=1 Tax=Leptospira hartskeerlii TaxID=2023177 RepID=A0A2M9XG16_9LEPT|nr:DUF418 domain-containing protein [Leptospira hartskeerlii]PJZ26574.1 hypothetical protein CH357_03505 [Leptospira hartskeerlii]PJZ34943.1 hypothetical protein CH352_04950 [Leptospira hartskeerlii]